MNFELFPKAQKTKLVIVIDHLLAGRYYDLPLIFNPNYQYLIHARLHVGNVFLFGAFFFLSKKHWDVSGNFACPRSKNPGENVPLIILLCCSKE